MKKENEETKWRKSKKERNYTVYAEKSHKVKQWTVSYFINCFKQRWYDNWQRNGWVNSKGQDVANQDIWTEIVPFFEKIEYSFEKVKGHAGDVYNEKCDKLAQFTADQEKARWRGKLNE